MFRALGFTLSTLRSVTSNVFKVPKSTVDTFDGTDHKADRINPKVRNMIFFPPRYTRTCLYCHFGLTSTAHCAYSVVFDIKRPVNRGKENAIDLLNCANQVS